MKEIWKDVVGYEGLYKVSSLGKFKKIYPDGNTKDLKTTPNNWGYYTIGLRKNGRVKQFRISRLIAQAFIPNPDNKPYVDHIDTNKANNCVENLRWVTPSENSNNILSKNHMLESWKSESRRKRLREINIGGLHPRARAVYQMDENDAIIKTFTTAAEASREVNCKPQNITKCCTGERQRAGGYKWKYV